MRAALGLLAFWILPGSALQSQTAQPPQELRLAFDALKGAFGNLDAAALEDLLSDDADLWTGGNRAETGRAAVARRLTQRPGWPERSAPFWRDESIRVLTPDIALIDARLVQFGSVFVGDRNYALFVFRKEKAGWRVASIRLSGRAWGTPRIVPAL